MKKLKMTATTLTFEEGCNKYLEYCRQRNLREGTINSQIQIPSTDAKEYDRHNSDSHTKPLYLGKPFAKDHKCCKRCQHKTSTVHHRKEDRTVDHAGQIQIQLIVQKVIAYNKNRSFECEYE